MITVIVSVFVGATILAQKRDKTLTTAEAVTLTLSNNLAIRISEGTTEIAKNSTSKLNAGYLPTLSGNASATYQNQSSETTFESSTDTNGNTITRPPTIIDNAESQLYSAGLNLDYTLFDGLGRKFNYKTLKENHQLSEIQTKQVIDLSVFDVLSIYYEAARLSENIAFSKSSLEISKKRLERAKYQFKYGQTNKLSTLNAEVDIANDSITIIQLEQQQKTTIRDLRVLLNEQKTSFSKLDTTIVFISKVDLKDIVSKYKKQNLTLLAGSKEIEINDLQLKTLRATFFPRLNLIGSYGWNRNNNPAGAFFGGNTAIRNTWRAGIGLSWNIFNSGSRITNFKNAKIAIENSNLIQQNRINDVNRLIDNAWFLYNSAEEILKLQQKNIAATQNNFKRSKESFKLGQLSSIEYRQAQLNLLQAKFSSSSAKYQLKLAEIRLLQLSGSLLKELR